jgi:hypothetical protein
MPVTPIDLFASFLHLHQGGEIHAGPQAFDSERDGWRPMTLSSTTIGPATGLVATRSTKTGRR